MVGVYRGDREILILQNETGCKQETSNGVISISY
jgi:hypothetical protein